MNINNSRLKFVVLVFIFLWAGVSSAQIINFNKAGILASKNIKSPVRETAIQMLQEEVASRTAVKLPLLSSTDKKDLIVLAKITDDRVAGLKVPKRTGENLPETKPEGIRVVTEQINGKPVLWLIGADERGVIFAIGQFLRTAELTKNKVLFDKKNETASSPKYAIRGHQIGYRNSANSWDSWTPEQYEKYIRELAIFGTNAIENIPFEDSPPGPLMKLSYAKMNLKISQICNKYDLDYWVWTPADADLSDPVKFAAEVKRHADYYKVTPRLDGVFFPGGDPGDNDPKYVMPFLKAVSAELKKYHPHAGVWLSMQGFSDEQVDYVYDYLKKYQPDWLEGIVSGPSSPDIAETRFRLPKKYKHRLYPDITHSTRCQFPVLNWDQAFALTEGREVCNPQPFYYASIFKHYVPFTNGFISYSDGSHDDVNKVVWSELGWNPDKPVEQIVEDYCRFFFGPTVAKSGTDGILGLERNWVGPIEQNGGIETTFAFWQNLEKTHPELKGNWRWQQLVMRAYYDTYDRRRKIYEEGLEKQANQVLAEASKIGANKAMTEALAIVNKADQQRVSPELRQKVFDYCEALWKSIGAQTSVKKYHASGGQRGAILDYIDYPFNNRWWLADQFDSIRKMPTEKEKLARLEIIRTWSNPGPGSYYDNISNPSESPHVTSRTDDAIDYAWWDNGYSRKRLSTQLFQFNPVLVYHDLDPNGHYIIRVSGFGDALLRADGVRLDPSVYNKGMEEFKEFHLAQKYVADGDLTITFDIPEESKINWRHQSRVSDVWLLKK